MPLFSLVVPAYNAEATLRETLDAISRQSCADWECIVVDDGSLDSTAQIAVTYAAQDSRFRVIGQVNKGTAGAYNTGVGAATGHYIVVCSADDVLLPHHLQAISRVVAERPEFDIYSTNGYYWKPDDSKWLVYEAEDSVPVTFVETMRSCFYGVGAVYRRHLFEQVGGYRSGTYGEDYDFWLRAMAEGATHTYYAEPLSLHRVSELQKSADVVTLHRSGVQILRHLQRTSSLGPPERAAVAEAIRERRQVLAELGAQPERYLLWMSLAVNRLLRLLGLRGQGTTP